jgi:chorismate mutase
LYLTSFSFCYQLLVKEQEVAEKAGALKEASGQIENLKVEVTRLRRYEEELANLQVSPKNPVLLFIAS